MSFFMILLKFSKISIYDLVHYPLFSFSSFCQEYEFSSQLWHFHIALINLLTILHRQLVMVFDYFNSFPFSNPGLIKMNNHAFSEYVSSKLLNVILFFSKFFFRILLHSILPYSITLNFLLIFVMLPPFYSIFKSFFYICYIYLLVCVS